MSPYKKIAYASLCSIILICAYFIYPTVSEKVSTFVKSAQDSALTKNLVQEVRQELFSSPLRGEDSSISGDLSSQGVITFSNEERSQEGLQPLTYNAQLTVAAQNKLDDMFKQQYFEHVSPQGNGPGYLAEQAEYSYIIVGENLALGNFTDDKDLVGAWMASPGHRANIMHTRFEEIGVAVGEGLFNGKKTWLAVQEFGTPSSSCPIIDASIKNKIDTDKITISQMTKEIEVRRAELQSMSRGTPAEQQEYNKKIDEYNDLVVRYDALSSRVSVDIETYNKQVRAYNICIKG